MDDYVLALLYKSGISQINRDPKVLYPLFKFVFQKSNIKELNSVVFNNSQVSVYSSELYESLFRLESSLLLPYIYNINESYYVITDELRESVNFDNISLEQMNEIEIMSQLFFQADRKLFLSSSVLTVEEMNSLHGYSKIIKLIEQNQNNLLDEVIDDYALEGANEQIIVLNKKK